MTRLHLMTWSLERSPVKSRLSRVPWSRSPRAPPVGASYTGASLRRSRSVPRPCVLYVQLSGPIIMLLFGRRGHRQISTVTRFQAHPSGFLHWSRSPRAPPIGAFYTGVLLAAVYFLPHWRCPQSALGPVVSLAPSADRCLNPSFLPGCCPPSQASLLH